MAKSMAASLTAAVRCDGYAGQSCCVPGSHTAPALEELYQPRGPLASVVGVEFLTSGAPTADIMEYPVSIVSLSSKNVSVNCPG